MTAQVIQLQTTYESVRCIECSVEIVMPVSTYRRLRNDHGYFYCLNGHVQHFTGKSDVEKLREELARKQRELDAASDARAHHFRRAERLKHSRDALKGHLGRVKRRVGNGVCPCCNRTFRNLARHMKTKHKGFKDE